MATLEEIMLGLKSQEEDDKKEGFSNALLGQVTPTITAQVPGIENITLGQAPMSSLSPEQQWVKDNPRQINSYAGVIDPNYVTRDPYMSGEASDHRRAAEDFIKSKSVDAKFDKIAERILGPNLGPNGGIQSSLSDQGFPISPSILGQVPGIENITLGQAPSVSQEGIQYQPSYNRPIMSAGTVERSDLNVRPDGTYTSQATPFQVLGTGFADALDAIRTDKMSSDDYRAKQAKDQMQTGQQAEQVTPTIQSITGVEQAQEQAPQPQATFTLPSGEVRSIEPGQGVASAFGRESGRPMTFQVDGGEVTIPSVESIAQTMNLGEQAARQAQQDMAMQTMNLGEQAAARQAQQEFLASPAAREMSNRMLRSVMYNDPYAQASAERVARMEAKPDFNRAVSDRERRGTGEMSMASATKLTGGDRDKARAMIELQRQGRDPMTGKEVEAPFEPKEIEIGGKKYIQYTPNYIQPVEEPKAPKKSEIESIREEGVKAGLPENLIRQSIASKLGLDIYDEGVKNWMAGNTDTMPSVEGASESSTPSGDTESSDVLMIGTDGKTRRVPATDKEAALKAGYTLK